MGKSTRLPGSPLRERNHRPRYGDAIALYEERLSADREWARLDSSRHFEKDSQVFRTLRDVTKRLDELGIPYAVAGAMAMFEHGVRRFTEDVVILVSAEGLKQIHKNLVGRGYRPKFEGAKNLRDAATGVSIEFIVEGQYPGDGRPKPVAFPNPTSVAQELDGIKFLNLPALVELKLASGMTSPDRAKDLVDVQELIRTLALPSDFADQLNEYVQPRFRDIWRTVNGAGRRYVREWRSERLIAEADSILDMVESLCAETDGLEQMLRDGIVTIERSDPASDRILLVTTDPAVARKYQMYDESEFLNQADLDD
jgi:hypothetical protein